MSTLFAGLPFLFRNLFHSTMATWVLKCRTGHLTNSKRDNTIIVFLKAYRLYSLFYDRPLNHLNYLRWENVWHTIFLGDIDLQSNRMLNTFAEIVLQNRKSRQTWTKQRKLWMAIEKGHLRFLRCRKKIEYWGFVRQVEKERHRIHKWTMLYSILTSFQRNIPFCHRPLVLKFILFCKAKRHFPIWWSK